MNPIRPQRAARIDQDAERPDGRATGDRAAGNVATSSGGDSAVRRRGKPRQAPDTEWGRARAVLGWSLAELEERTGINRGELSRIERGLACPKRDQARRLNAVYDAAGVP